MAIAKFYHLRDGDDDAELVQEEDECINLIVGDRNRINTAT